MKFKKALSEIQDNYKLFVSNLEIESFVENDHKKLL